MTNQPTPQCRCKEFGSKCAGKEFHAQETKCDNLWHQPCECGACDRSLPKEKRKHLSCPDCEECWMEEPKDTKSQSSEHSGGQCIPDAQGEDLSFDVTKIGQMDTSEWFEESPCSDKKSCGDFCTGKCENGPQETLEKDSDCKCGSECVKCSAKMQPSALVQEIKEFADKRRGFGHLTLEGGKPEPELAAQIFNRFPEIAESYIQQDTQLTFLTGVVKKLEKENEGLKVINKGFKDAIEKTEPQREKYLQDCCVMREALSIVQEHEKDGNFHCDECAVAVERSLSQVSDYPQSS